MRFLVTGSNGLIGSRICRRLLAHGHDVMGLGRGTKRTPDDYPYRTCELGDQSSLFRAVLDTKPDVIVHGAAMRDADQCERDPKGAQLHNVTAVETLAKAANALEAHLLNISTDYVFDGRDGPYAETATPSPLGVYGRTKREGERAAQSARQWSVVRTAVVYGLSPPPQSLNFGFWLWQALSAHKPVPLFSDQIVTPTHADNAAAMIAELAERTLPGIWHAAGADALTRVRFGEHFCEVFGFDRALIVPSRLGDAGLAAQRPPRSGLLTTQASDALENRPWDILQSLHAFRRECEAFSGSQVR